MDQHYTLWNDSNRTAVSRELQLSIQNLYHGSLEWDVTIKPHRRAKTCSQRGWFHKLMSLWGDAIGLTPGQCKEIVKGYHFGWRKVKVAGIEFTAADGTTEDLDRLGYSELIETAYRLAAEMEVVLPPPDITKSSKWRGK